MDENAVRSILKSQYHSALAMLKDAIEKCPENLWSGSGHKNECWQIAYHVLFFAHAYSGQGKATFRPWKHHRADAQHPDCIPGPADPASRLPLLPDPYTKAQVLEYWSFCDGQIDAAVDAMDLGSPQSGFPSYPIPKLEHQIVNLRHIQHHAAQLADRVRTAVDEGVRWVGARRQPR